jgi:hypothetical protein
MAREIEAKQCSCVREYHTAVGRGAFFVPFVRRRHQSPNESVPIIARQSDDGSGTGDDPGVNAKLSMTTYSPIPP